MISSASLACPANLANSPTLTLRLSFRPSSALISRSCSSTVRSTSGRACTAARAFWIFSLMGTAAAARSLGVSKSLGWAVDRSVVLLEGSCRRDMRVHISGRMSNICGDGKGGMSGCMVVLGEVKEGIVTARSQGGCRQCGCRLLICLSLLTSASPEELLSVRAGSLLGLADAER
jgi:hypothetical protein